MLHDSTPEEQIQQNSRYLQLLKRQFPNVQSASTEIINLQAILNLPKGTEHFLSDLHGEYEAFQHVLKNGSGVIRKKIEDVFRTTMSNHQKNALAQLIYYPEDYLAILGPNEDDDFFSMTLHQLIKVCREVASKYTRSKVRKALPAGFDYILEELLHEQENVVDKYRYYDEIINSIIRTGQGDPFIIALCELIQRLAIDHLHVIGDIYDRGPGADIIMDTLCNYHSVDIQWGNHDIGWLGAVSGSLVCIANTIRVTLKSGNLHTLEDGYGINLLSLAQFAMNTYPDPPAYYYPSRPSDFDNDRLAAQMHQAISIIQFKLEGDLVERHPEYGFESRLYLDKLNLGSQTVRFQGKDYPLRNAHFPTLDEDDPYAMTCEEADLMSRLKQSFLKNERLNRHMSLLLNQGSMYLCFNGNLLYHGCIPMNADGSFQEFIIDGVALKGKPLMDTFDRMVRETYNHRLEKLEQEELDFFWYLSTGECSPLFGKKTITTFERYYISDPETHHEPKNAYYQCIETPIVCQAILREFGLDSDASIIINGHVPVKVKAGESPVKANGKLIVIDGGLSKAYHSVTGIAGYTLIYNSHGMILAAHEPFESKEKAIAEQKDIISKLTMLGNAPERILVADTDNGKKISQDIQDLELLLYSYRKGLIK